MLVFVEVTKVVAAFVVVVLGAGPAVVVGFGGCAPQPLSPQTGPPGGVYGLVAEMSRYSR